ncbi:methyltransferase domain-containing protein [Methanolobus sp. ZRKC3]|uniref:class I SAM-dependent methyltransferase n=1 Tax=Methanolobus sp. ZRKC3 TaxID=3125786 RepID=UPI00324BB63D
MSLKTIGKVVNFADSETMELLALWKEAVSEVELNKHTHASSYIHDEYSHYIILHEPLDMQFSKKHDEWNKRFCKDSSASVAKLIRQENNKLYFKGILAANNSSVYGIIPYTSFDNQEATYPKPEMEILKKTVYADVMPVVKGKNMLDIGCGLGAATIQIAQNNPSSKVTGVDLLEGTIRQCRLNTETYGIDNVQFEAASVYDLPFENRKYDAVTCFFMLHHLDDIPKALSEIGRVLDDGGKVFAVEPLDHHHGTKREEEHWITLFEDAGFNAKVKQISRAAFIEASIKK